MIDAIGNTRSALQAAHKISIGAQLSIDRYRLAFFAIGLFISAMAFDLLWPTENALRGFIMLAFILWIYVRAKAILKHKKSETLRLDHAARLLENRHPELENALINAVQFSERTDIDTDNPEAHLMRSEIARAEKAAGRVPLTDAADIGTVKRVRTLLVGLVACLLLSAIIYPRAWRYEVPRFLLFWGDYQPFSLTDFSVSPRGTHVRPGGSVTISVTVGGLMPDSVYLVTGVGRDEGSPTPMISGEPGVYKLTLDSITRDTWFYIRANTGRTSRYYITVDKAPKVKTVVATVHPPAYSHKPASTAPVGEEGISGLFSASVDIEVASTRPLDSVKLQLTYPDAAPEVISVNVMQGLTDHAKGSFTIKRSGKFTIDLTSADGQTTQDAYHNKVTLLRDEKPIIYVEQPGQNAMISPTMTVPLKIVAEDDISVQRIELHRIVNDMPDSVLDCPIQSGQKRAETTVQLNFRDLGVRPGDVVQYYATAYDANPGTPNLADSDHYWIWVVSSSDYTKALQKQRGLADLAQQYRAPLQAMQELAQRQADLASRMGKARDELAKHPHDQALQKQLAGLQNEQRELQKSAADLARDMRQLAAQKPQNSAEKAMQMKLRDLAKQVEQAARSMQQASKPGNAKSAAANSAKAAQQLAKSVGSSEKSIEKSLQAMEKLAPLYQDVERLKELSDQQNEIASQSRELSQRASTDAFARARLGELAQRQAETRRSLDEVRKNLVDHADACSKQFPKASRQAKSLAKYLNDMKITDSMHGAQSSFERNESSQGAELADQAKNALKAIFSQSKQCQNGMNKALDDQLSLCSGSSGMAGSSLSQLAGAFGNSSGVGQENGSGTGSGSGGQPAPTPGTHPGEGGNTQNSQRVLAYTNQKSQGSSDKRNRKPHEVGAEIATQFGDHNTEHIGAAPQKPPTAKDQSSARYPVEYRRLVKDYFKTISEGK